VPPFESFPRHFSSCVPPVAPERAHSAPPVRPDPRAAASAIGSTATSPSPAFVSTDVPAADEGLQALAEAHTLLGQQEERWWAAEIHRLRGVLLLRQTGTPQAEAEAGFHRALNVARRQEAKSLELRASMSLGRLWQQQGKWTDARQLLAPIYGWFTQGFETADLQEAKASLEELS
jgi:predicted ATPase